jgi:hypothetical protein
MKEIQFDFTENLLSARNEERGKHPVSWVHKILRRGESHCNGIAAKASIMYLPAIACYVSLTR